MVLKLDDVDVDVMGDAGRSQLRRFYGSFRPATGTTPAAPRLEHGEVHTSRFARRVRLHAWLVINKYLSVMPLRAWSASVPGTKSLQAVSTGGA